MSLISYWVERSADVLYDIASACFEWGAKIRGVYLLGAFLTPILWDIGSFLKNIVSSLRQGNNHFNSFYYDVMNSFARLQPVMSLLWWMDRLIDFISNPLPYIIAWIRQTFWWVEWIYYNAYEFIFPHVVRLLDTYFPQWRDIAGHIYAYVSSWVHDWNTFRFDPVRWVVERLRSYSYNVSRFLSDPDGYLRERVNAFFPDLQAFIFNPAEYIINKLADRLEVFAERNLMRLVKIAENIISAIF